MTNAENPIDLLRDLEPVLDQLIGWINTDYTGCVEVEERGTAMLNRVRRLLDNTPSDPVRYPHTTTDKGT